MRNKYLAVFSEVMLSPDTCSLMDVRIYWYHQSSYFSSQKIQRSLYYLLQESGAHIPFYIRTLENLQTQTGLSKEFMDPYNWNAQEFFRPWQLNFFSSSSTFNMVASFLALHGGFWYSRVICSHIQSCRKEDVSFSDIPTKESLYFSDSDWVICPSPEPITMSTAI